MQPSLQFKIPGVLEVPWGANLLYTQQNLASHAINHLPPPKLPHCLPYCFLHKITSCLHASYQNFPCANSSLSFYCPLFCIIFHQIVQENRKRKVAHTVANSLAWVKSYHTPHQKLLEITSEKPNSWSFIYFPHCKEQKLFKSEQ